MRGTDTVQDIRFGRPGGFADPGQVNLNAGEATGIDTDVTLLLVEMTRVYPVGGPDVISGAGGAGTGAEFHGRLLLYGGDGGDLLIGGSGQDWLDGQKGGDTLRGRGGAGFLLAEDGVQGNDVANGGAGDDACQADPGDTKISC